MSDLTNSIVQNIDAYPRNDRITYVWDKVVGATSYEYSLDGGSTFTSTGTNNYVKLTGLAASTTLTLSVRALSSATSTQTAWSQGVSSTTTSTPTYRSIVMDKDPVMYLPLNETSGSYKDYSHNRQMFTPLAEARGKPPLTSDSTQSVSTTTGTGVARGSVMSNMNNTNMTMEVWLSIPTVNVQGSFLKIGDANGWGFGVGTASSQSTVGRTLNGLTEGVVWMTSGYLFPTARSRVYHVVTTKTGTNYAYFIDGVQVGTSTSSSMIAPTGSVHVGTISGTGRELSTSINIDSVAIYPTALTQAQITENYQSGARMDPPTPLESMPLNGGIAVRWPAVQGAQYYDVSTDGGTTWTTQNALPAGAGAVETNSTQITGKPNGTPVSAIVRARTDLSTGGWSASTTSTPSSTRYVVAWDDFNRAPSTTNIGSPQAGGPYTQLTANTWGISVEGQLYPNTGTGDLRVTFPGTGNFDYTYQMPTAPNTNYGIIFRWIDTSNYMMFYRYNNSSISSYRLWRMVNGIAADLWTSAAGEPKTTDIIRVVGVGANISVYINGIKATSREDIRATGGSIGTTLGYYANNSANTRMDNVVVWNTPDFDVLGPVNGKTAHVYKGRDNYNDDLGNTP